MYKHKFKRQDVDYIVIDPNASTSYNSQYWHVSVYLNEDKDKPEDERYPNLFAFDKKKQMLTFLDRMWE